MAFWAACSSGEVFLVEDDNEEKDCCLRMGVDFVGLRPDLVGAGWEDACCVCAGFTVWARMLGMYRGPALALLTSGFNGVRSVFCSVRIGETKGLLTFLLASLSLRRLTDIGDDMLQV